MLTSLKAGQIIPYTGEPPIVRRNMIYLIGSLRNPRIPELAKQLRKELNNEWNSEQGQGDGPTEPGRTCYQEVEVFDDWFAAGPEADDCWKDYEINRGRGYQEALHGHAARNVFNFDKRHLDRCTHAILVLPAGKSGHLEIMYATYGVGAKTAILLDETDVRWDVMYQFIPTILDSDDEIKEWFNDTGHQYNLSRAG